MVLCQTLTKEQFCTWLEQQEAWSSCSGWSLPGGRSEQPAFAALHPPFFARPFLSCSAGFSTLSTFQGPTFDITGCKMMLQLR